MTIGLCRSTIGSLLLATAAVQQVAAAGIFGRPAILPRWGSAGDRLDRTTTITSDLLVAQEKKKARSILDIRGGETAAVAEEEIVDEPQVLYLPGLLDAVVVRSNAVRRRRFPTQKIGC